MEAWRLHFRMRLSPGVTVDRYVVLHPLGSGGSASVFAVRHAVLKNKDPRELLQELEKIDKMGTYLPYREHDVLYWNVVTC